MLHKIREHYATYIEEKEKFDAFIEWARKHALDIRIRTHFISGVCTYSLSTTGILRRVNSDARFDFLITSNSSDSTQVLEELGLENSYKSIYSTPTFDILVKKNSKKLRNAVFSFSQEDKMSLCDAARALMLQYLISAHISDIPATLSDKRLNHVYGVDVAVWCDGELRSSIIVLNHVTFRDSFIQASCDATHDVRFRPLTVEELARSRIEIVLMSDLHIPIFQSEIQKHVPYVHVGHMVRTHDRIRGWFLPMVFNCSSFQSYSEFVQDLIVKKARIPNSEKVNTKVYTFPVSDFIETATKTRYLYGPVLQVSLESISAINISTACTMSANWLTSRVEQGGYLSPVTGLTHVSQQYFDMPRAAHAALSLSIYGLFIHNPNMIDVANRIMQYCVTHLAKYPEGSSRALTWAYLGQSMHVLGNTKEAFQYTNLVNTHIEQQGAMDIITRSQIARLFQLGISEKPEYQYVATFLIKDLISDFFRESRENRVLSLAEYAEIIVLTKAANMHIEYEEILDKYLTWQTQRGGFPNTPSSSYEYVRGTGKVLEAICYEASRDIEDSILRAFTWLASMQYTEDSAYHISKPMRPFLEGGFRHDYTLGDAWIDSTAHVLIAGARYLTACKDNRSHPRT